jgi:hypothetical protein
MNSAGILKESSESESEPAVLEEITITGYTGGGVQLYEAEETQSSSSRTVGRSALDSLQHDWTNFQSVSENPRGSASNGFIGRSPLTIAGTGVRANNKWWNGRSPVKTWDG